MTIHVVCFGLPIEGPRDITVEPDPAQGLTVRELITRYLAPRFDGPLEQLLCEGNHLREDYAILVNGRNALSLGGLYTVLDDQADVLIMPPVGGG